MICWVFAGKSQTSHKKQQSKAPVPVTTGDADLAVEDVDLLTGIDMTMLHRFALLCLLHTPNQPWAYSCGNIELVAAVSAWSSTHAAALKILWKACMIYLADCDDVRSCTLADGNTLHAKVMILFLQCNVGHVAGLQLRCRPCLVCSTTAPCHHQAQHLARHTRIAELQEQHATGHQCTAA